jgi:hypothetical protein
MKDVTQEMVPALVDMPELSEIPERSKEEKS